MSFSGSSHKKECKEKKKVGGITFWLSLLFQSIWLDVSADKECGVNVQCYRMWTIF
jgi:hypothetical protein